MTATVDSKTCSRCGCVKSLDAFYKTRRNKDGLHNTCKSCTSSRAKELRDARRPPVAPKSTTHKVCSRCKQEKPFSEFGARTSRGYYQAYCKPCAASIAKLRPKKEKRAVPPVTPLFRVCPMCKENLPKACFGKDNFRANGLSVYCINCNQTRMRAWVAKNLEKKRAHDKAYYEAHRERYRAQMKEYIARNAEILDEYHRRYRRDNAGKIAANNIARIRSERQATPSWANFEKINAIYAEAKRLFELDGIERHVDHVVPIKHKLVCGLHVEHNLQILTAAENMAKKNRFEVQ